MWVIRSLLRQGIWGSGLDTLLTRLRAAIKEHGDTGFPVSAIEATMGEIGKSLAFDEVAVEGLLLVRYGDRTCFPLLSLLNPSGDTLLRHVDHVYPQTAFVRTKLDKLGIYGERAEWMLAASNAIPNLQLLTPADNESKGGRFPLPWLESTYPDRGARAAICALHHFDEIGDSLESFPNFFEQRRELLAAVIRERLGVPNPEPATT